MTEIDINIIKPYERNAKKHPNKQIDQIANSIKEFGFNQPLVIDKNNVIVVGHGRYLAAKKLGLEKVPIIQVENLNDEQTKAYRLADNKLNESEWDINLAIEELKGLSDGMKELTGFDLDLLIEPDDKDDVVPENAPPVAKLGDIWQLGRHRLMCGDSTKREDVERLMDEKKVDMVFIDPPYGIDYSGGRTRVVATKTYGKLKNDDLQGEDLGNLLLNVFLNNKSEADVYICVSPIMQTPFLQFIESSGRKIDAVIVWDKKNAGLGYMAYRRQTEFILFIKGCKFKKGDNSDFDLWSIEKELTTNYKHGTQKPVALSSRAIKNSSKADDIVLDLFGGSGSTLIACEKTNRVCHMMELEEKYCDVIIARWENYTNKKAIKL